MNSEVKLHEKPGGRPPGVFKGAIYALILSRSASRQSTSDALLNDTMAMNARAMGRRHSKMIVRLPRVVPWKRLLPVQPSVQIGARIRICRAPSTRTGVALGTK